MKIVEWANSRLGESVSDLYRAKIRLGEFYSKNASGVAIFLEVVHCSFDEYLRRIPQHLHELHRKVPRLLSCYDKDAMTVKTQKKPENYKLLKS